MIKTRQKRIWSILLSLALLLNLLPVGALAESTQGGSITIQGKEGSYTDLAQAVEAADKGDTVVLNGPVFLTSQVTLRESITLEGGGNTITAANDSWSGTGPEKYMLVVAADGVTIQNLTVDAAGKAYGGIQFYACKAGYLENVTARNAKELGLSINAAQVTARGRRHAGHRGGSGEGGRDRGDH